MGRRLGLIIVLVLANGFFALKVAAAPAIVSLTYNSGTIAAPNSVYAREAVVFTANVTDGAGLVYVWSFGDKESAIGDAGNNGRVTHLYDKAFASVSAVTKPTLRLYSGSTEVASRFLDITVQAVRLPANAASLTVADQVALPDKWPFANITRVDGPGAYLPGSTVDFRANESVRGTALSQWDASQTFQWTILDAAGVKVKEAAVNINTEATGAFNFSSPTAGWYMVTLRANQLNSAGGGFVPVYDTSTHAFSLAAGASANAPFSLVAAGPAQTTLDLTGVAEPFSPRNYRADATVTGGVLPLTYIWNYPNDLKAGDEPEFNTVTVTTTDSANQLNATFNRSGGKNIYLTVFDATFRKQTASLAYTIINAAPGVTPFSPTLDIGATPSPLLVTLVENSGQALTVTLPAALTPPPQTFEFLATAANGTPPYQFQFLPVPAAACLTAATTMRCAYTFNSFGTHSVTVTVTDGSTPAQSESFTRNVLIQQAGATPPPGGGVATPPAGGNPPPGGTTPPPAGDTGTVNVPAGTVINPLTSNFGLSESSYSNVGLNRNSDFKTTITNTINWVLGFLGVVAVVLILWGGFKMMTASGDEEKAAAGKKTLVYAVIGLVVIFLAWGIASFVLSQLKSVTA